MILSNVPNRIFKLTLYFSLTVVLVLLIEGIYFFKILHSDPAITKTDAIVIFNGAKERIEAGCNLARLGYAPYLIISPADSKKISAYQRKYTVPLSVNIIKEDKARTTFENALYCKRIIKHHQFNSIVLVTSDYHMPRSYLLMKIFLTGSGINIQIKGAESVKYRPKEKRFKIVYNEMLRTWGSLAELVCFQFSGQVPETPLKSYKAVQWLKSVLLFNV
jgi:uncharacterized SAM-binding protein YcdF (DUF218 family)